MVRGPNVVHAFCGKTYGRHGIDDPFMILSKARIIAADLDLEVYSKNPGRGFRTTYGAGRAKHSTLPGAVL
jgi:hypothetical protein